MIIFERQIRNEKIKVSQQFGNGVRCRHYYSSTQHRQITHKTRKSRLFCYACEIFLRPSGNKLSCNNVFRYRYCHT